jgi:type I restriction enzyme S subunit
MSVYPIRPLGEIVENLDAQRRPVKSSERRPGPYPYFGAQGIVDHVDGFLFDGEFVLVAEDGENLRSRNQPIALMARGRFWVNNHAHILRGTWSANTRFLFYALNHADISGYVTGSTIPKLSQGNLNRILVPCPSIDEQRAIVAILGALDDKIDLNRRMNQTLEAMARAIFQDWFVTFGPTRAKQEGRPPYLAPDLWSLFPNRLDDDGKPAGWQVRKVVDVLDLAYGKALPSPDRTPGPIPVYGSGGITGHHDTALVDGPGVIVGRKGTVGSLYWEDHPFYPIDTVFYVVPRTSMAFCFYLLRTLGLEGMNTDAAVPGLNRNNVYRLPVPWAPEEVRQVFDSVVMPLRAKISANDAEARTLAATRDLLLPKLMSGELRVKEAERLAEAAL